MLLASFMWVIPQPAKAKPKVETKQVIEQPKPQVNVQSIQEEKRETVLRPASRPQANGKDKATLGARDKTHTSRQSYSGRDYSKEEVENLIRKYSDLYGISSDTPRCIAFHESGYNQTSANKHSSAKGVFQYLDKTWKATDEGKAGLSVFDA